MEELLGDVDDEDLYSDIMAARYYVQVQEDGERKAADRLFGGEAYAWAARLEKSAEETGGEAYAKTLAEQAKRDAEAARQLMRRMVGAQ